MIRRLASLLFVVCCANVRADVPEQAIRAALLAAKPDLPVQRVVSAEVPGLYRVELHGGQFLYATADGKYFIAGDMASATACGIFFAPRLRYFLASEEFLTAVPASEPSSKASVVASFGLSRTKAQNVSSTDSDFAFFRLIKNSEYPVDTEQSPQRERVPRRAGRGGGNRVKAGKM